MSPEDYKMKLWTISQTLDAMCFNDFKKHILKYDYEINPEGKLCLLIFSKKTKKMIMKIPQDFSKKLIEIYPFLLIECCGDDPIC